MKSKIFNELLPWVSKPAQYIGNEVNMVRKDPATVDVRVALLFPEVYEVGMSYLGFPILYQILNAKSYIYAERAFLPWFNMADLMRKKGVPLFSLETFSPLKEFDVIGITLQHELNYTNVLESLDLAGIPLFASERKEGPLIVGGGPSAFNPEPAADFFDLFLIGDGEEAVLELAETVRKAKKNGVDRQALLTACSQIKGMYVPQFYQAMYGETGAFSGLERLVETAPQTIRARITEDLLPEYYPQKPLVPVIATTHDRVALEIARGCSRGCRFCNAGMIYRPVRQRPVADITTQAVACIANTGYDEVSLLSLSTADYRGLAELLQSLKDVLSPQMVNISFPSLRPEKFTAEMAHFARTVRKSGLTLAPEAGSQRLRDVINKATSAEALLQAIELAFSEGWKLVKLYFMIGQPSETDDDLQAMADLIGQTAAMAKRFRGAKINVAVSPFVPKAITPFQWVKQDSPEETERKIVFLREKIRHKTVNLSWHDAQRSVVEGVLARGDRRLSRVIYNAWKNGAKLEGWNEFFSYERWLEGLRANGLSMEQFTREIDLDASLPWDHIDKGVTKKFLRDEYHRALGAQVIPDCCDGKCNRCGLMGEQVCQELLRRESSEIMPAASVKGAPVTESVEKIVNGHKTQVPPLHIVRVRFSRGDDVRYISHLDFIQLFTRAMRRADWPLQYSEGFNPHAKISFGPPLPTGFTSSDEYFDAHLCEEISSEMLSALQKQLPHDVDVLEMRLAMNKPRALMDVIDRADYRIYWSYKFDSTNLMARIAELFSQQHIRFERRKPDGTVREIDLRPYVGELIMIGDELHFTARIENGLSARVEEILKCLFPQDEERVISARIHREKLWVSRGTELLTPLDILSAA